MEHLPLKTVYFIHTIIADLANKKISTSIKPINLATKDSFTKKLLYVQAGDFLLNETELFSYQLKTAELNLSLISQKPPLLENQTGYINLKVKDTYYYSLTNLKAEGELFFNNKKINVKGSLWLDHQWANCGWQPADDKWTWFSVQLKNGVDIVCFEFGGKTKTFLATMTDSRGRQKSTSRVILKPLNISWQSPKTGANYQLEWKIFLPEFAIELRVKPYLKSQEMIFGVINYWEGGLAIDANVNGEQIDGLGFLEIAGESMKKSISSILEKEIVLAIKNKFNKFFKNS